MNRSIIIDPALVSRHGAPSPSYACYPEVVHFHRRVGAVAYRACAQETNEDPIPAALSLRMRCGTESIASLAYLKREIERQGVLALGCYVLRVDGVIRRPARSSFLVVLIFGIFFVL